MPLSHKRDKERKRLARGSNLTKDERPIYFILDRQSNAVKIGIAESPEARLRDLQVGNPHTLELVKVIPGGNGETESGLHNSYRKDRLGGEWFRLSKRLSEYLAEIKPSVTNSNLFQPKRDALQSTRSPLKEESNTRLPRMTEYNRNQFKPGDKVLILRGKQWLEYLVPDVDGSGQEIPDYF